MGISTASAGVYHDLNGLAALRRQAHRDAPAALEQAAAQFESLFLQMMMKSMRAGSMGDPLLGSQTTRFYRDMYDRQLATDLGGQGALGIAEMLVRQLGPAAGVGEAGGGGITGGSGITSGSGAPAATVREQARSYRQGAAAGAGEAGGGGMTGGSGITGGSGAPAATVREQARSYRQGSAAGAGEVGGSGAPAATGRAGAPAFATQAEFLDALRPHAEAAARRLGVAPDLLLAQAALETGWGRAIIQHPDGRSSHNLFGIKADGRWDGPRATVQTLEYEQGIAVRRQAPFRAYDSFAESFRDYADFILGNARYQPALAQAASPAGYMRALQEAGYATDPQYAEKVLRVWREGVTPRLEVAARDAGGAGRPDA